MSVSLSDRGLALLRRRFPGARVTKMDEQPETETSTEGPWVRVEMNNGESFAVWKSTGAVYRVLGDGTVGDDPFLRLDDRAEEMRGGY